MKKVIRQLSEDGKTMQVTIADERWYLKELDDGTAVEYPSVTWISSFYPKGIGFYKYLADKGWEKAQEELVAAGNRGTKVHEGVSLLLLGNKLSMDDELTNPETGEKEEITLEEWEGLMSFVQWHEEHKPETILNEFVVFNDKDKYAGTVDYVCKINGETWVIDFKTSKDVWPQYEIQIMAYSKCLPDGIKPDKMGILQLNYRRNKYKKWKMTEVKDEFDLFIAAKRIWQKECSTQTISKKDYPTSLTLS